MKPFDGLIENPIPGTEMKLGPFIFFVPPMRLKDLRSTLKEGLLNKLDQLKMDASDPESMAALDEAVNAAGIILHRALKRNYPDLELTVIEDLLDVSNIGGLMGVIMETNLAPADRPTWAGPWGPAIELPSPTSTLTNGSGSTSNAPVPPPSGGPAT